jgi:multidrug efflux pump subunit AcrA (membrane-fusion protein)
MKLPTLFALLLAACASHETHLSAADFVPTLPSFRPHQATQPKDLELTAVITSRTASSVTALSDANVVALPARTDGYVHQGDLLVQLDVSDLRTKLSEAESSREKARGEAGHAGALAAQASHKAKVEGMLARTGSSARESVTAAVADANAAGAEQGAAAASIKAADIQIADAKRLIEAANIKSPMDGTISQIKVHVGEGAHRGQTLAKVFDPSDPIVKFALPHNKRDLLKSGDTVQMIVGDHAVPATVTTVTDDHDAAIDFFVVTAELSKTNRPADVKVGATGFVRIADKGAVR